MAYAITSVPIPSRLSLRGANQLEPHPGTPLPAIVAPGHHHRAARSRWLTSAKLDIHRTIAALKAAIAYLEAVLTVLERMQA